MRFGVMLSPRSLDQGVRNVAAAEAAGFDFVGLSDSQSLLPELHTTLGRLAPETETVEFGPSVTNPVTRHPVVTASAMATLDQATGGRAVLGVASGDSAVFTLGERPAKLADLVEFVELFRTLVRGGTVEYGGKAQTLTWLPEDGPGPVPVMVAADGPKTQRAAGSVADRVLIGNGRRPAIIEASMDRIDAGAAGAGRDPEAVERWAWVRTLVTDAPDEHGELIARIMAAAAHHNFQFGADEHVPDAYAEAVVELARGYESDQHADWGTTDPNGALVRRLDDEHPGFLDHLIERFAVIGSPAECVEAFSEIGAADGVAGIHCMPMNPDNADFLSRMGEAVRPAF